ncbi:MAG TPA: hypothetical protein VF495_04670 [Phenylobacterium sp.]
MAWKYPLDLAKAPLVLAGPMLRKVTSDSVTVWFALQKPATDVRLTVMDTTGPILAGHTRSYAIGKNLHLVAVTANQLAGGRSGKLVEGVIYTYDVAFDFPAAPGTTMLKAMNNVSVGYAPYSLPSFCLPPADLNKLRLIHGSCRHPNADGGKPIGGRDALALLNTLIKETADQPDLRPHQLFLTGDQIYADDVAGHLLLALTQASDLLLGWQETLPFKLIDSDPFRRITGPRPANKSLPYTRKFDCVQAGFTSDVPFNHLLSLGEYICMYLFVWSDVLWTTAQLPTEADLRAFIGSNILADRHAMNKYIAKEISGVSLFRESLADVRRALANIPTYMILDDHDVTDDFNMEREFFETVYSNPLGLQVVQNGLVAYALCQHWGNAPELFAPGSNKAGEKLLLALDGGDDKTYAARTPDQGATMGIRKLVGIHTLDEMKRFSAASGSATKGLFVFHDPGALTYDYTVEGPMHQVLVTDSRTWRLMPDNRVTPQLLPKEQIERQVTNASPATILPKPLPGQPNGNRLLIVIVSTNFPPSRAIRFAGNHGTTTRIVGAIVDTWDDPNAPADMHPDVYEAWELPSAPFDRMVKAISDRLPLVDDGEGFKERFGAAVILSGDVHHSFSTRLLYEATTRFEDPIPAKPGVNSGAEVVIAQLISSSLRNRTGKTIDIHREGYKYHQGLVGKTVPEGYVGWNVPAGTLKQVFFKAIAGGSSAKYPISIKGPTTIDASAIRKIDTLTAIPDYSYRFDYLTASSHYVNNFGLYSVGTTPPNATPAQRLAFAQYFDEISGNYRTYNKDSGTARQAVGVNNIGEVTVVWENGVGKQINHTLRWITDHSGVFVGGVEQTLTAVTTYGVSLDPRDPAFLLKDVLPPVGVHP